MPPFPGNKIIWQGHDCYNFHVDNRATLVVAPKEEAPGRPWVWRARFFGHEPQADVALLGKGFHVAFVDVSNLYGGPQGVAIWDRFYEQLTVDHGLAPKAALEGFSRGGLIIYNWAAKNVEKVACLYGDAPVCDIKSWPGGKGVGTGSPEDWQRCLDVYGLTEESAMEFKGSPVDNLESLAAAGVPILHVCGDADVSVPMCENSDVVEARYRALGGSIGVISKPGCAHHPHALEDPTPIVEFILRHVGGPPLLCAPPCPLW